MKNTTKTLASIAVVGTVAAVAIFAFTSSSTRNINDETFLSSNSSVDTSVEQLF